MIRNARFWFAELSRRHCIVAGWTIMLTMASGCLLATAFGQSGFITTSDGVRLHYVQAGRGRAILFVPGWTMPADIWEAQLQHFATSYRVVALDPRSQGESAQSTEGNYPERRAQDIKEVVDQLKLSPVVLVGWSMGVADTLSYVDQYGTKTLSALVLVEGLIGADPNPERATSNWEFVRNMQLNRRDFTDKFVRSMFRKPHPEDYYKRIVAASLKTPTNTAAILVVNRLHGDWRPVLNKVNVPVLYVGRNRSQDEVLKQHIPHVQVEHFPDAGHAVFVDDPQRFNSVLEEFLRPK